MYIYSMHSLTHQPSMCFVARSMRRWILWFSTSSPYSWSAATASRWSGVSYGRFAKIQELGSRKWSFQKPNKKRGVRVLKLWDEVNMGFDSTVMVEWFVWFEHAQQPFHWCFTMIENGSCFVGKKKPVSETPNCGESGEPIIWCV